MGELKRSQIKNFIRIISLLVIVISTSMPIVNIMDNDISFSMIDFLQSNTIVIEANILGSIEDVTISYSKIAIILTLFLVLIAMIIIFAPLKNEIIKRRIYCILSILVLLGLIASFATVKTSNDFLELRAGIGLYIGVAALVIFSLFSIIKESVPIIEINIYLVLLFIAIIMIYPYINTLALSFDKSGETVGVIPKQWTIHNYTFVILNPKFLRSLMVTIARTILGTITALICTTVFSYGMSKPNLIGRKLYMKLCIFTMYFGGGLIPTFLLYKKLGLVNNFMVYIIPNLINIFNMILMINYFKGLPVALEESAKVDGAKDFKILFSIIIPVSMPIVAIITLFNAVFQWNSWYDGYLYMIDRKNLLPLQNILIDIINQSQISIFLADLPIPIKELMQTPVTKSVVSAAIIVTIGPIILFYPYLQKYFVQGMLLGSLKE